MWKGAERLGDGHRGGKIALQRQETLDSVGGADIIKVPW